MDRKEVKMRARRAAQEWAWGKDNLTMANVHALADVIEGQMWDAWHAGREYEQFAAKAAAQ